MLNKVTGMDFNGKPYPPEVPKPDTKLLPMKADPMEPVPPAQSTWTRKSGSTSPTKPISLSSWGPLISLILQPECWMVMAMQNSPR
jgi:hypothetical protein